VVIEGASARQIQSLEKKEENNMTTKWPLERVLFALAGSMALLSVILVAVFSPWFLILTAFVGINQWMYVAFGACPASLVLKRLGLQSQCGWK
jgi:Flp pilus assembly protein TadB